jgi:hypothetical protein
MNSLADEHFRKIFDYLGKDPVSTTIGNDNFFIYKPTFPYFSPDSVKTTYCDDMTLNIQDFIDGEFKKIENKFKKI